MSQSASDRFHAHLDHCERCRNNPFNLCAYGRLLIAAVAAEKGASHVS